MDITKLYPRTYLAPADLGDKEFTLTIADVRAESVFVPGENKKARRAVVMFAKAKRGLLLSAHNAHAIEALYGPETDNWNGKTITLYVERGIKAFGKTHDVVRVKKLATNGHATELPDREDPPEPEDTGDILPDDESGESGEQVTLDLIDTLLESGYLPQERVEQIRAEVVGMAPEALTQLHDELNNEVNAAMDQEAAGKQ
jgi:hypothetical protein